MYECQNDLTQCKELALSVTLTVFSGAEAKLGRSRELLVPLWALIQPPFISHMPLPAPSTHKHMRTHTQLHLYLHKYACIYVCTHKYIHTLVITPSSCSPLPLSSFSAERRLKIYPISKIKEPSARSLNTHIIN